MPTPLGTARWAEPAEIDHDHPYRPGCVWLGRSLSPNAIPIGYGDDRHITLVSGSRGGKGTTTILNTLLDWPGSVVVVDPKGENATITAGRRGSGTAFAPGLGQNVHVLDPFSTASVSGKLRSRFNPLDALDPQSPSCIGRARKIAEAIMPDRENAPDPYWENAARSMLTAVILHVLTDPVYEGRRSLITVRQLLSGGDQEAVRTLEEGNIPNEFTAQELLWAAVKRNPALNGTLSSAYGRFLDVAQKTPRQFYGALENVLSETEFLDDPLLQDCLTRSDFKLSDLKTASSGISLYLSLPEHAMQPHYRWLRLIITLIIDEMQIVKGRPATGSQVLMILDEFACLKRMPVLEDAVAQLAGHGLKMFMVLQSLEQLKANYKDKWETFLANSGLKFFFNLEDNFSREYVSKLIGDTEIIREVRSASATAGKSSSKSMGRSTSFSQNTGTSSTRGASDSTGTSHSSASSHTKSESSGTSSGTTHSGGSSWSPWGEWGIRVRSDSVSAGCSSGRSSGESESVSFSRTDGSSTTHASSWSEGESQSSGFTRGENYGETAGSSESKSSGLNETVHRRPLVNPDEIGILFASINNPEDKNYPGLGLALVAGKPPVCVRRVNYYEDLYFIGAFDQHPDHIAARQTACINFTTAEVQKLGDALGPLYWHPLIENRAVVKARARLGEVNSLFFNPFGMESPFSGLLIKPKEQFPIAAPCKGRVLRSGNDLRFLYYADKNQNDPDPLQPLRFAIFAQRESLRRTEAEKLAPTVSVSSGTPETFSVLAPRLGWNEDPLSKYLLEKPAESVLLNARTDAPPTQGNQKTAPDPAALLEKMEKQYAMDASRRQSRGWFRELIAECKRIFSRL